MLPLPSNEQKNILYNIKRYNVMTDSVAGSGKTTTNLLISMENRDKLILILTYNRKLKEETRIKVNNCGLNNTTEVHSYHSFCVKYYDNKCYTDSKIIQILKKDKRYREFNYDIVIIDEAQDMTKLYFNLICKIIKDNKKIPRFCILGDKFQSIYDFNNADSRYITLADKLFKFSDDEWVKKKLSISFRLTKPAVNFINNCIIDNNRIKSIKDSKYKPRYIICDCFGGSKNIPFKEVCRYLNIGYNYSDIFILAPSVKSPKSPVRILANKLSDIQIPIYVPVDDNEKIDEEITKNKLVFSTYHQTKGLERKVIIVFNFDNSYFIHYKKKSNPYLCPNELYVAVTRSLEQMTLFHHYCNDYFPFLKKENLNLYTELIKEKKLLITQEKKKIINMVNVKELIKFIPSTIIEHCLSFIKINKKKRKRRNKIILPTKSKQKDTIEAVSEINGIAIPAYYEYIKTGNIHFFNKVEEPKNIRRDLNNEYNFIDEDDNIDINEEKNEEEIKLETLTCSQLLKISNEWNSIISGYKFKVNQIDNYNWLNKKILNRCVKRLNRLNISDNAKYEYEVNISDKKELFDKIIKGYIDCIDNDVVYEFKCVNKIDEADILQLAIYMYICKINFSDIDYNYKLYNIIDDSLIEIYADISDLENMMSYLIFSKYYNNKVDNNSIFIDNNKEILEKYI